MKASPSLITPIKGKNTPRLGATALMVATDADLKSILNTLGKTSQKNQKLYLSHLCQYEFQNGAVSMIGPLMGAPYAAILLETLIAWGVRHFIFLGWCGSISHTLKIGDIFFPQGAFIDEGTSRHYDQKGAWVMGPEAYTSHRLESAVIDSKVSHQKGGIWTTDALFRETLDQITFYQKKKADAVDMETSALFSVARFYDVSMDAVLVVSDELSSGEWIPGFTHKRFKQNRKKLSNHIVDLLKVL